MPLTAAITGWGIRRMIGHQAGVVAHRPLGDLADLEAVDVGDDAVVLEVEPGAERPAGPGEDDDRAVVVGGARLERRGQLDDQLDRHGVEPLGSVQRDDPCAGLRRRDLDQAHADVPSDS